MHTLQQPAHASQSNVRHSTGTSWHSGHSQTGPYAIERDHLMLKFETVEGDIDRHDVDL
jgi:hypothetical protein